MDSETKIHSDATNSREFNIGLGLALSSSLFIGSSFIIKKLGLRRLSEKGLRASNGGFGYLRDWVWWLGFITMGVGEAANFIAYGFAPASLVTPLGAISILVSAIFASKFLNERLNLLGKIGCLLCVLGSTIVVIHAPKEVDIHSFDELISKITTSGFIYYAIIVIVSSALTVKYLVPSYGNTNVIVYTYICSTIGSLSVICCKGISLCIRETLAGTRTMINLPLFLLVIFLLLCICVQMNYLNKALDVFNTAIVNPIYYVFFTSSVIIASAILFQEWKHLTVIDSIANITGFLVVIIAIFMLSAFKDIQITLLDVYPSKRARNREGHTDSIV